MGVWGEPERGRDGVSSVRAGSFFIGVHSHNTKTCSSLGRYPVNIAEGLNATLVEKSWLDIMDETRNKGGSWGI